MNEKRDLGNEVKASFVMNDPIYVTLGTSVQDASKIMKDNDIGSVLVVDNTNKLLGILTNKLIIKKLVSENLNASTTMVDQIMDKKPFSIYPDTSCKSALDLMAKHNLKRVPVEHNGEAIGFISVKDIAEVAGGDEDCASVIVDKLGNKAKPITTNSNLTN